MRPTFRYFLFLNLFFHTICIIKSDSSSSCPTTRQQYIFVYVKDKKSVTSEKLQIKHLNTQYDCEVECVRRLECHSYDFLEAQHLCELNLNEGDNLVVAKEGWVHVQKKLVPVDNFEQSPATATPPPTIANKPWEVVENIPLLMRSWTLQYELFIPQPKTTKGRLLQLKVSTFLKINLREDKVFFKYQPDIAGYVSSWENFALQKSIVYNKTTNITIKQTLSNNDRYQIAISINNTVVKTYEKEEPPPPYKNEEPPTALHDVNITITGYKDKFTTHLGIVENVSFQNIPDGKTEDEPAKSCKWIKEQFPSSKSGTYWLMLEDSTNVYCDMETQGGGWLMIGNLTLKTQKDVSRYSFESNKKLTPQHNESINFLLDTKKMSQLYEKINFKEIRLYCTKPWHQRVFHAIFEKPSAIYYIVGFNFSMTPIPTWSSCNDDGMTYLSDDTSAIKNQTGCKTFPLYSRNGQRLYNHFFYRSGRQHVQVYNANRLECDDQVSQYTNDEYYNKRFGEWRYYVR